MHGKPLLVELVASAAVGVVDWRSLDLILEDEATGISHRASEARSPSPGWIFESSLDKTRPESSLHQLFLRVKVFLHRTTVRFRATVKTQDGQVLSAKSPCWYPTASGQSKAKEKKPKQGVTQEIGIELGAPNPAPSSVIPGNLQVQDATFSDFRLKEDILDLRDAHQTISSLHGCRFTWRDGDPESLESDAAIPNTRTRTFIGFLAQEVYKTAPECVSEVDGGWLAVDYAAIAPLLVEALKWQMSAATSFDRKEINEMEEINRQIEYLVVDIRSFLDAMSARSRQMRVAPTSIRTRVGALKWYLDAIFTQRPILLVLPLVILLLVGISVSVLATLLAQSVRPASLPPTSANITFKPLNYLVNGGFEEPKVAWEGSGRYTSYQDSTGVPGSLMKSKASFDAGSYFMLVNATAGSPSPIRQSNAIPVWGWASLTLSVQAYLISPGNNGTSTMSLELSILDVDINRVKCSFQKIITLSTLGDWELPSLTSSCLIAQTDVFTVTITSFDSSIGLDDAQLYLASIFQADQTNSIGNTSTTLKVQPQFEMDVSGEFSCRMVEYAAPEQFLLSFARPLIPPSDFLDVGVLVVTAPGSWNTSFGTSGVALAPRLRQTQSNLHFQWMTADSQNRILLVGSHRIGDSSLRAVVIRLTSDGQIDSSFGSSGATFLYHGSDGDETGAAVFLTQDDSVIVFTRLAGASSFALVKLNSSGDLDFGFGASSSTFLSLIPHNISAIDISPSGRIALVAANSENAILIVLNSSGVRDESFGDLGVMSLWPNNTLGRDPIITCVKIYMVRSYHDCKRNAESSADREFFDCQDGSLLIVGGENSTGQMDPFALKFDRFGSLFVDYTPFLPSSTLVKDFVLDASIASDSSLLLAIQQPDTTYFVSLSSSGSVDSTAFGGTPLNLPVTLHGVSSRFSATSLGTVVVTTHKTIKGHADVVSFVSSTTTRIAIARSSDFPPLLPPSMSAVALSRSSSNFYVLGNAYVNISESTPAVFALDLQSPTSGSLILSTGPRNTTQSVSLSLFVNQTQAFYLAQRRLRDGQAELVIERRLSSGILDMKFSQTGTLVTMKAIISMKMTNADARPGGEVFCAGGTYAGLLWIAVFNSSGQLKISYEATLDRDLSLSSIQAVERYSGGFFVLVTAENDTSSILVVLNSNLSIVDQVVFANSQLGCMVLVPELGYLYLAGTARPAEGTSAIYRLFSSNFSKDPSWLTGISLGNDSTVELSSLWWDPRRFRLVGMGSASTINTISRVFFVTIHPMTSQIDCSHIYRGGLRRLFPVEDGLIETASIPGAYASLLRSSISSAIRVVGENALDQCVAECGDGAADLSEECDDGNQRSGDGCSSLCRVEVGWSCVYEGIGCRPKVQAG